MGHVSSRVVFVCTVWVLMTMGGVSCQKSQEPQAAAVDAESGEPQAAVAPESGEPQAAVAPESGEPQAAVAPESGESQAAVAPESGEPQAAVDAESGEPQAAVVPESGEPQAAALPPLFVWGTPASVEARIRPILEAGQPLGEPALLSMTESLSPDEALRFLEMYERRFGASGAVYSRTLARHPWLHAASRTLTVGVDVDGLKKLGGGSTLVYRLIKDKTTIAAYKPFQKRFQSNYRSEIAAYRLCPVMKCGFDVPVNLPVVFEFQEFSRLYARNASNPKAEFTEIIPTPNGDGSHRVDGTFKQWIPEYADFPIELKSLWRAWLNPGTTREDLQRPASEIVPEVAKKHELGARFADKLAPHLENLTKYELARQISNLIVFDFLVNNWDRFSGVPKLYGINCQIVHGRLMSIDNGAAFAKTPNSKPRQHLEQIQRFSRLTYDAIRAFDKESLTKALFPSPSPMELEKIDTFWALRDAYLNYVEQCIEKNGEDETFFFE